MGGIWVIRAMPELKSVFCFDVFPKCWDPLDLSQGKNILDLVYIHPVGMRIATDLFFCDKSANLKHPTGEPYLQSE